MLRLSRMFDCFESSPHDFYQCKVEVCWLSMQGRSVLILSHSDVAPLLDLRLIPLMQAVLPRERKAYPVLRYGMLLGSHP